MRNAIVLACALLCGCGGAVTTDWTDTNSSNPSNPPAPRTNCTSKNLWAQSNTPWLQTKPQIHLVFWGSYWLNAGLSEADYYATEWSTVANDPAFYKPMQEYGIQTGQLEGIYFTNPNIVAGNMADNDVQSELKAEIASGQLPTPDSNRMSMYVLMFPPTTTPLYCAPGQSCSAYHGNIGDRYTYQAINYASDPYNNDRGVAVSHEIYESATDADGSGYWTGNGETEVGDYCNGSPYYLDGYSIQQVWSQDACQCIPATGN